jgi:hypothetical protein
VSSALKEPHTLSPQAAASIVTSRNMGRIHIYGATRASIIQERTRNWIATSNATQHVCLRHCTDGNLLWTLWERIDAAQGRTRYISCDVLLPDAAGCGYRTFLERDELAHVSCPPSYLRESPVLSATWRDQVRVYWSQRQCRRREFSAHAIGRSSAQRFKEGDRVRYIGPSTPSLNKGETGMIVHGRGPYGASIHADELCNSLFVNWDQSRAHAVFVAQLEREALSNDGGAGPADAELGG